MGTMNTPVALNIWVFFCRKNKLMLERQGIKSKQVFLGGTVLVVQLENQSVTIDTFYTTFPFAPSNLLVMVMQHM